jgi:hypothetical protein
MAYFFIFTIEIPGVGHAQIVHEFRQLRDFFCFSEQMNVIRHETIGIQAKSVFPFEPFKQDKVF